MNKLFINPIFLSFALLSACGGQSTNDVDHGSLITTDQDYIAGSGGERLTDQPAALSTSAPPTNPPVSAGGVATVPPELVIDPVSVTTPSPDISPSASPTPRAVSIPSDTATPRPLTTPSVSSTPQMSPDESDVAITYVAGSDYIAGAQVSHNGSIYQCLIAGWCRSAATAYEPGVGFAWQSAWRLVGADAGSAVETSQNGGVTYDNGTISGNDNGLSDNTDEVIAGNKVLLQPQTLACLPDGLSITPGSQPNLCAIYDSDGREMMGADHPRRVIGYFTSWRTGKNHQPAYLVNDIPWDKITHINYAFAHINSEHEISVGDVDDSDNPATGLTWQNIPGAEMDPSYPFYGHFNLLAKYKKHYPDVKTLISVGGWAETGGHFNANGRDADGGFYTLTIKENGEINTAAIETFSRSVVDFLRTYEFDGVDIDYEYPTSMVGSGNPDDAPFSEPRRANLWAGYMALMKSLRAALDHAGEEDNRHYLLTIASPSSGYLLRGMEAFQAVQYLDYVNIMSYDLHGAWNAFVGPNAALFDDGEDAELTKWGVYGANQYDGIGYLNTDWAYHYFRGAMAAGRINIGIPYYTRGWQNVVGGRNGLWGTAPATAAITCTAGTGNDCGYGAQGIDNLWHDLDANGHELFAGSNPMWHAMNLHAGIRGSYLADYGLTPETDDNAKLFGDYTYHYDDTLVASWLWNAEKRVFLSIEDETSFAKKLDWVMANGIGGVMFWEMAGDYSYDSAKGEYVMGQTLTDLAYTKLSGANQYAVKAAGFDMPEQAIDMVITMGDFAAGDSNYPIAPRLTLTNKSDITLPGGTLFEFDLGTSTSADIVDQSGMGLIVIDDRSNAAGNNVGGLTADHHRVQMALPNWQSLAPGASIDVTIRYYLPAAMPSNWTVTINNESYAIVQEQPSLPRLKRL